MKLLSYNQGLARYGGPGRWNDLDMLEGVAPLVVPLGPSVGPPAHQQGGPGRKGGAAHQVQPPAPPALTALPPLWLPPLRAQWATAS